MALKRAVAWARRVGAISASPGLACLSTDAYKMVLCVRTDVGMKKGKMAAQAGHAAIAGYKACMASDPGGVAAWEAGGSTKVAVKVGSLEAM